MLTFLLLPQCDVNTKSVEGATPLHLAALAGHTQVGRSAKCRMHVHACKGGAAWLRTPCMRATPDRLGCRADASPCPPAPPPQVVACLCRAPGVHLNATDLQGRMPLHLAAARGHDGAVVELWARGAAIDSSDLHGWSPLHYAARAGHTDVAAKLVIAGSHVASRDPHGVTAAHPAAERGFSGAAPLLGCAGRGSSSSAGLGLRPASCRQLQGRDCGAPGISLNAPSLLSSPVCTQTLLRSW